MTAQRRSSSMWSEHDIPPLPAAHAQAITLLGDRDIEVRALAEVVESDAALTSAVLRAANSALSAPSRPMTTARDAIVRIGLDGTLNVVSGAIVHASFRDLHRATLDVGELWRHVIATALLADAEAVSQGGQTEAFTAGLLHDVGRLSMAAQEPLQYAAAVALMRGGMDAIAAESQIFGFSHVEWGVRVARAWGIPEQLVAAIGMHHVDSEGGVASAVREARELSAKLGIGDGLPATVTADSEVESAGPVCAIGGSEALFLLIDWYSGAFQAAA